MRKERLAIQRQLDSSRAAREQSDTELTLQGGDPLRDGLLRHAELVGRVLQLPELGRPDKRSHCLSVHCVSLCLHNRSLWLADIQLFETVAWTLI